MTKQLDLLADDEDIEAIPAGKIKCFIKGTLRKDTPEEQVRQEVARSLVDEYSYSKADMDIEFSVKMGRSRKRADIVVFKKDTIHKQENVYIIVEVKQEKINPSDEKEGLEQLKAYVAACMNTRFALWIGSERLAFGIVEREGFRDIEEVPDIPKSGDTTVPRPTRGDLVPAVDLKKVFKRVHNYIHFNQGFQKDRAFEELLKLIFVKVYDEQYNATLQFYILPDEPVSEVRQRLSAVFKRVQERYKYIFKGNEQIELNDPVLRYIVSELGRFTLVDTETDVKGNAYEEIVRPNLSGARGEFFTPRTVCNMVVNMLFSLFPEDKLTSPGAMKILDPAVGTGGFLISIVHKIKDIFLQRGFRYDQLRNLVRDVSDSNFSGIDFNPFLVKVAQMSMVMHGDGSSNIVHADSLKNPLEWNDEAKSRIALGDFDIVITNPPFGTKGPIDSVPVLEQYELRTYGAANPRNALPPEQLFVERCLNFLKPGGYLGIVLPDSILSNPGLVWIRDWILKKAYIIASIDLPVETFEPYTGTQTSILILKKKTLEQQKLDEDYDIFMAIPEKVGHDRRGHAIFRITPDREIEIDEDGQPIIDDHLSIVSELFKDWIRRKGIIQ